MANVFARQDFLALLVVNVQLVMLETDVILVLMDFIMTTWDNVWVKTYQGFLPIFFIAPVLEGSCNVFGTLRQENNKTCTCKAGYVGVQCNACDSGYHFEEGLCHGLFLSTDK